MDDMGSMIIATNDVQALAEAAKKGIDDLCSFTHLDLEYLMTIDFESAMQNKKWADSKPVYFNEADGIAVMKINSEALDDLIARKPFHEEFELEDLERLEEFVQFNGTDNLYEVATF
jgi:hypothetical protein